jgi:hypothetical protein
VKRGRAVWAGVTNAGDLFRYMAGRGRVGGDRAMGPCRRGRARETREVWSTAPEFSFSRRDRDRYTWLGFAGGFRLLVIRRWRPLLFEPERSGRVGSGPAGELPLQDPDRRVEKRFFYKKTGQGGAVVGELWKNSVEAAEHVRARRVPGSRRGGPAANGRRRNLTLGSSEGRQVQMFP